MLDKKFLEDLLIKLKKIQSDRYSNPNNRGHAGIFFNDDPLENDPYIYTEFGEAERKIFEDMRRAAWKDIYGSREYMADYEYAQQNAYRRSSSGRKADPFKEWVRTKAPIPQRWHPTNVVEMSFINEVYVESVTKYRR